MTEAAQQFGDLVHFKAFGSRVYQINHPSLIEDFFLKNVSKHPVASSLWDRYCTGAARRQRRSVELYSIVKRA
jgi:hypothetical protein